MAIPRWPSDLPQRVLQDGYSEKPADGRLRTQTDWGPGKVRRRFSAAARPITAQLLVEAWRKTRFDRFWNEDTRGGTLEFIMPEQITDGNSLLDGGAATFITTSGSDILVSANWLARFGDTPTITPMGALFTISFQILVLP